MHAVRTAVSVTAIALATACAGSASPSPVVEDPTTTVDLEASLPEPPWGQAPITTGPARAVGLDQWQRAPNRAGARLLLLADTLLPGAVPRPAAFEGGWAVAWDQAGLPGANADGSTCADCGRGTIGIAGVDVLASRSAVRASPLVVEWSDGGLAGFGAREADDGPRRHLATIVVPGQADLYQLWSYVGEDHLEYLLTQLRFVEGGP